MTRTTSSSSTTTPPFVATVASPAAVTGGAEEGVDEKTQSFRKRRLSLPLHQALSVQPQQLQHPSILLHRTSDDDDCDAENATKLMRFEESSTGSGETSLEDGKAQTFRKRRLSLTTSTGVDTESSPIVATRSDPKDIAAPAGTLGSQFVMGYTNGHGKTDTHQTASLQGDDHKTAETCTPKAKELVSYQSRTLHSGELIQADLPPPSPATAQYNILYQATAVPPPGLNLAAAAQAASSASLLQSSAWAPLGQSTLKPKWIRRHTVNPHTELHKLPFSPDVVGTYSCHGVEPIYDEDEEVGGLPIESPDGVDTPRAMTPVPAHGSHTTPPEGLMTGSTSATKSTTPAAPSVEPAVWPLWYKELVDEVDSGSASRATPTPLKDPHESTEPDTTDLATEMVTAVAKINQDRGGVAFPYGNCPKTALFAVYDGHGLGGEMVSQFALHEIQQRLERHEAFPANLERAFKETFCAVDLALIAEPMIDPMFAGTTACVALLQDKRMTLSNAGDSRCVCARRVRHEGGDALMAMDLTTDQNPDLPEEMERIMDFGGYVTLPPAPGLSARVWLDAECTQIGLAMARSIGDHAIAAVGVIAEPVVTTHDLTEDDLFFILASDGVWEFLSSADAVGIVHANLDRGAAKACQALIEAAAIRWHEEEGAYRDDITAIVVRLQDLWK